MKGIYLLALTVLVFVSTAARAEKTHKICGHNEYYDWDPVPNPDYDRKYRTVKTFCFNTDGDQWTVWFEKRDGSQQTHAVVINEIREDWHYNQYRYVEMATVPGGITRPYAHIRYFPENPSEVMTFLAVTPEGYDISALQIWTE